jgi:perosamine synthetase
LIEDACQALGAEANGIKLGAFGDVGVFSLSPHKIITTGQGGVIVTSNKEIYERIKKLKDFGRLIPGTEHYPEIGYNFKFTDLQAVFGLAQLKTIDERMEKKKQIYEWYFGHRPDYLPWFMPGWAKNRTRTLDRLKKAGIGARPFYPPLHSTYKTKGDFPNTNLVSAHGYWLPSSLSLTKSDVDYVLDVLSEEVMK